MAMARYSFREWDQFCRLMFQLASHVLSIRIHSWWSDRARTTIRNHDPLHMHTMFVLDDSVESRLSDWSTKVTTVMIDRLLVLHAVMRAHLQTKHKSNYLLLINCHRSDVYEIHYRYYMRVHRTHSFDLDVVAVSSSMMQPMLDCFDSAMAMIRYCSHCRLNSMNPNYHLFVNAVEY